MPAAPSPTNEVARLEELFGLDLLDTPAEQGFDDLTRLASRLAETPISLVSIVDADRQWFKSRVGLDAEETPRSDAFCAYAILDPDDVLVVEDATKDARFADNPLVLGAPDIRFYAGAPLVTSKGLPLGTLCVIDTEPRDFPADKRDALAALARQVVAQIELRRKVIELEAAARLREYQQERLERSQRELEKSLALIQEQSITDPLTGLRNRRALMTRLDEEFARWARYGQPLSVAMVDIDHFKQRNDSFGHAAGDAALVAVAECLELHARDTDVVARYGGEEFMLILPNTGPIGSHALVERIRLAVAALDLPDGSLTISAGIATADRTVTDSHALIVAADEALYEAKASGRNRTVLRRTVADSVVL